MATSFHLFLKNRQKQNGEYPIYLRITNNRKHKYLSTGLSVKKKHWNPESEEIRRSHDNYKTLNESLDLITEQANQALNDAKKQGKESAQSVKDKLKMNSEADFFSIADEYLKDLIADRKLQQKKNFEVLLNKVENFEKNRFLDFERIDVKYLDKFERFLKVEYENGLNTIHKNFKLFKIVIKRALKSGLIDADPFIHFEGGKRGKTKPKVKLTIKQIHKIEALELKPDSWEWHVRNAFLFSFYSGGIRFGDICCLKWKNVKNGKLYYKMNKNEKPFSTELNDYQKEILSRYSGASNEFIFPFLNNHKDYSDLMNLQQDINTNNVRVNGKKKKNKETGLKLIAKMAGIDENVSFHVSRHSFAQYAVSERGLDVYELMQTLRHSKIETTQSYLKSLNEELADKAMKKVF